MDKEHEALGRQEENAAPSTATQGPPRAAYLCQTYNSVTPAPLPGPVVNQAYTPGYHHFYLRNHVQGALYFCTAGLFGVGWLVDLVRIPSMVKATNDDTGYEKREKRVAVAYLCAISPLGIFGGHHFYLNRPNWGLLYAFTHGLCGIGWLVDWFRVPLLVRRANKQIVMGPDKDKHLDDAYMAWFPLGLLGLHHFYLNRPGWGIVYFFTFGLCGIGWIVDIFRMPCLVKDANTLIRERQPLPISQAPNTAGIVVTATPGPILGHTSTGLYPQQHPPQFLSYPPPYQLPALPGPEQLPAYMEQPPPYSPADGALTTAGGATTTTSGLRTSDE